MKFRRLIAGLGIAVLAAIGLNTSHAYAANSNTSGTCSNPSIYGGAASWVSYVGGVQVDVYTQWECYAALVRFTDGTLHYFLSINGHTSVYSPSTVNGWICSHPYNTVNGWGTNTCANFGGSPAGTTYTITSSNYGAFDNYNNVGFGNDSYNTVVQHNTVYTPPTVSSW